MPSGKGENAASGGNSAASRQTFRPPWVKEGPPTTTQTPAAPWALANRKTSDASGGEAADVALPPPSGGRQKTGKVPQENGANKDAFVRPQLKPVPAKEPTTNKLQSREVKVPVEITQRKKVEIPLERVQRREPPPPVEKAEPKKPEIPTVQLRKVEKSNEIPLKKKEEFPFQVKLNETKKTTPKQQDAMSEAIDTVIPSKRHDLIRQESLKNRGMAPPAPPMAPPMPPPPPKMPKPDDLDTTPLTKAQQDKLDMLRQRSRKRPDWAQTMKEIESGKKLKHVHCNDRSQPLLPEDKAKGQFVYESEKENIHNQLLKAIQGGINLKRVKTNDRSKPNLDGLRKFRRQMTIEEQIIKSQSMASMPQEEVEEADEMDDIDKVRDDLQSTKQLLAMELRNKEAQQRENKRLQARLLQLEAELEKERTVKTVQTAPETDVGGDSAADVKLIDSLKTEASDARKTAQDLEKKFHDAADQLDCTKGELEELKKQNYQLQRKLQDVAAQGGRNVQDVGRKNSSFQGPGESDDELTEEEPVSDDGGEDDGSEEKALKRQQREIKLLRNKLKNYKHKEETAKNERKALKDIMKKNQQSIKDEKKKYRALQKEVDKMATLMKDVDEDVVVDDDEEEKEEEEAVEEEETESESESDSESESSEEESSESEDEEAPFDKRKENLSTRAKRHENCLAALKKGNYMLKANAERMQDDLNKQREMSVSLQEDLDSVLAELG